ncbi:hypothetical protein KSP39_PZI005055 [Platanthera zijinensis]|uniref:Splicing factor 3B subunit 1 n=1 Tax=Platanthera zijinensis TaxID=2320716 RepID=A0AAP0GBR7_9ASPA
MVSDYRLLREYTCVGRCAPSVSLQFLYGRDRIQIRTQNEFHGIHFEFQFFPSSASPNNPIGNDDPILIPNGQLCPNEQGQGFLVCLLLPHVDGWLGWVLGQQPGRCQTGIKIAQQIAILLDCTVLPHPRSLVEIMELGLSDENQMVRTITALSLAALAETAAPYGIESFDPVLKPLWKGICPHRGKVLAAFLKAIGFIILLIVAQYSRPYKNEVMVILIREFQSSDEEMKKIVLKVLVVTTVEVANKVGVVDIYGRIVEYLKDGNEPYRRMLMETTEKMVTSDIDTCLKSFLLMELFMTKMTLPIKDLPCLTPILKKRHENVQENVINLVDRIADRGSEFVPAREWMRICFELLEMLKARKKGIRRATVNTFGCIAKAIGPQLLLQLSSTWHWVVTGLGCEDALVHLLNYVWPNAFDTSPHVINAVMEAIGGMRAALGTGVILNYCLKGLFHPARKVCDVY